MRAASKSSFEGELESGGYVSDKEEGGLENKGPVLDMAVMRSGGMMLAIYMGAARHSTSEP